VGKYLLTKVLGLDKSASPGSAGGDRISQGPDVTYNLVISPVEARSGATVEVQLPHMDGGKRVSLRIPAGVQSGTKLRLKEMGHILPMRPNRRGDLYIQLQVM
jgi:curved DNA-binding protein